jgi:hypothetical protein
MADADHGMVSWSSGAATVEDFALNADATVGNDLAIIFGADSDWNIEYDEASDDRLEFTNIAGTNGDSNVYWDLNDGEDSTFYITNSDGTGEANLDVEGYITAYGFIGDAPDGSRYMGLTNNTSGNQPTASTVSEGMYSYETDLYTVGNGSILSMVDSATGDIYWYGATDDNGYEYKIDLTDPTADRTITFDDNNVDFSDTTEDYVLKYNASTKTWSGELDDTGSALGTNLTSSTNDLVSDNDQISLEGTSEDIDLDFTNNTVTVTTDSGVTLFDFGALGIGGASLDLSEGNITNAGSISLDAIAADGTNVIFGSGAATQLQFRDSAIYIASIDDGHLDLEADTSIDLNAPVSGNGNWSTSGSVTGGTVTDGTVTLAGDGTVTGISAGGLPDNSVLMADLDDDGNYTDWTGNWTFTTGTFTLNNGFVTTAGEINGTITLENDETIVNSTDGEIEINGNLVIPSTGNIGSVGDKDAIAIAADGKTTFSQDIVTAANIELGHATENTLSASGGVLSIEGDALIEDVADSVDYENTTGSIKALTPVTDDADNFAANFTGANLYGGTFVANGAGDVDLPEPAAGMFFTVITMGDIEVDALPANGDDLLLDGVQLDDNHDASNTGSAGDIAVFQYYDADGWLVTTNGWTEVAD